MKALVTGATGFIGSTLIGELDTLGFEIRALIRKSSDLTYLEGFKLQLIEGDLLDFDSLCHAVRGVDYVFHLAGLTHAKNQEAFLQTNFRGTSLIARAVTQVCPDLTRFVYVSSLAAAGPGTSLLPRVEQEPSKPISIYGESKLLGEQELLKYKTIFPISIVRPPIVYGPKDRSNFLMIQAISRNFMPILRGAARDGHKYYSVIHSEDLSRGIVQVALASKDGASSGEIYYLTGDGVHTYEDLVSTIAEKLNREPLRLTIPRSALKVIAESMTAWERIFGRYFPLNLNKIGEILPDYWVCSSQKAKSSLGFMPEFDLTHGMGHTIDWYQRNGWL